MLLVIASSAAPALAQSVGDAPETLVTGWGYIVVALLLAICVCVASLKGSGRGHQD